MEKQQNKVTDRDIFNLISEKLQKQNAKSISTHIDPEDGEVIEGDGCQYFGHNEKDGTTLRCAVGWVMDPKIYQLQVGCGIDIEETVIDDEGPLSVVILSNPDWDFDKASWVMLGVFQRIHDSRPPQDWKRVITNMSYLFDSDGKFTPSNLKSFELEPNNLWYEDRTLDLESVGVAMVIPRYKTQSIHTIGDQIEHFNVHDYLSDKATVNMLNVETPQMSDVANINFLEIFSSTPEDNTKKEDIVNAG